MPDDLPTEIAYELLGRLECPCDEDLDARRAKLVPAVGSDATFKAEYQCPECGASYEIMVSEAPNGYMLSAEGWRTGRGRERDFPAISLTTAKWKLYEETHSASDLVRAVSELQRALERMTVNRRRIAEACDRTYDDVLDMDNRDAFNRKVRADVHNYLSSAYSFEQTLDTVESELLTDRAERRREKFETAHRIIEGLRIYVQHNLTLPFSVTTTAGKESIWLRVAVEDVDEIEKDKDRYPPDGYCQDADHHYSDVENGIINLTKLVEEHYGAARRFVEALSDDTVAENEDEVEEFLQLSQPVLYLENNTDWERER